VSAPNTHAFNSMASNPAASNAPLPDHSRVTGSAILRWIPALLAASLALLLSTWFMAQLISPKLQNKASISSLQSIDFIRPPQFETINEPEPEVEQFIPPPPAPSLAPPTENALSLIPLERPKALDLNPAQLPLKANLNLNISQLEIAPSPTMVQPTKISTLKPSFNEDLFPLLTPGPKYPRRARRAKISGWVNISFTITPKGTVTELVILAAEPEGIFEQTTLNTVKKWKFKPQLLAGKATARQVVQTIKFEPIK